MFFLYFLLCFSLSLAALCPKDCNGHGTCDKLGRCNCFGYYTGADCSEKKCPQGESYVDPDAVTAVAKDANRVNLVCSGKGRCNYENGNCECFNGFEGDACQRIICANGCSGHGICLPVNHMLLDKHDRVYEYLYDASDAETKEHWDIDQSYHCVCDKEYEGYDCSEKKCVVGDTIVSECEGDTKSVQTITITSSDTNNDDIKTKCEAYLEYTDMFNRKWYTDKLCVACVEKASPDCNGNGWKEALQTLPVGVIDLESVTATRENKVVTVTITFGSEQTGKQPEIKVITNTILGSLPGGGVGGAGYHGMTSDEIKDNALTVVNDNTGIVYKHSGRTPTLCSDHGLCDKTTGLCQCFKGFYGIACTEQLTNF